MRPAWFRQELRDDPAWRRAVWGQPAPRESSRQSAAKSLYPAHGSSVRQVEIARRDNRKATHCGEGFVPES
jgi:hypothetical protein